MKTDGKGKTKGKDKASGKDQAPGKGKAKSKKGAKGQDKPSAELAARQGKKARKVEKAVKKLKAKAEAARARQDAKLAKATPADNADAQPAPTTKPPAAVSSILGPPELARLLRPGADFTLADVDPDGTPGFSGDRHDAAKQSAAAVAELADLQERLFAEAKGGGDRSVLLIVQGMDTAGKGGIVRHVVGAVDPQGVRLTSFKAPTQLERDNGFLWRIRNAMPAPGQIGVFDRSHYEDVLIVRVRELVPRVVWARRYSTINAFERRAVANGTTIVKVMLHISKDEQGERLAERIARPDKYWKYNPRDIDERLLWDDYQQAYEVVVTKCSTDEAPWFVVPANHKWYARWAVQQLLLGALREIDPQWPPASFDPETEAERLANS